MFVAWLGIIVFEIVNHFLHPNRIGGGEPAVVDEAAHVAVRCGIHINRKGGERVRNRIEEFVFVNAIVLFAPNKSLCLPFTIDSWFWGV